MILREPPPSGEIEYPVVVVGAGPAGLISAFELRRQGIEVTVLAGGMDRYRMIGAGGGFLTGRAVKRAIDGALGSRGAAMIEPYSDDPGNRGLQILDALHMNDFLHARR